jgi:HEAT repeats
MTQYGQGSGIHLAVGGLIDEAGSDTYIMHNGLGQSGSHDFAASLLMDKAGNDRYLGNTSCNGCGLTNSVGLFFDRSGDDLYAARDDSGINAGRSARGFGSLGVFVDLGGADSYLGKMDDAALWQRTTYGIGLDYDPEKMAALLPGSGGDSPPTGPGDGFDKPTADLQMPDEVRYEGALTQEIFDKLWEIAIRWEVGDNRAIVPEARKRLIAFGPAVLPYIEVKMDDPNSLAVRGYVDVFKAFAYKPVPPASDGSAPVSGRSPDGAQERAPSPPPEPEHAETLPLIEALLTRQLQSGEDARRLAALSVVNELKIKGVAPALTAMIDDPDIGMRRRAIAALGAVGSAAANDKLTALLDPATDEALTKVSIETLCTLKADCYGKLRLLLGSPSFTVRDVLENQLVAQWAAYGPAVADDYLLAFGGSESERQGFDVRAKRTLLRVMLRVPEMPDEAMIDALYGGMGDKDWGVVADTVELARYWSGLCLDDPLLDILFNGNTGLMRELGGYAETTQNPQPLKLPEK